MSADDFREIVGRLRGWGFRITETPGCYTRSNGLGWARGVPVGHGNHHYVCSLNPAQSYIDSLVEGLMTGRTVNWFGDVNGGGYLIGVGPMNHFGQGNSSVLNRTLADLAPLGPSNEAGDMTGNTFYSGTELQHPGDSTPYPAPLVEIMEAISAAKAIQFGWSAGRIINHFEWTGRKIDMSWQGGRASGSAAGNRMRAAVAARMNTTPNTNTEEDELMATEVAELVKAQNETNRLLGAVVEQLVAVNSREQGQQDNLAGVVEQLAAFNARLAEALKRVGQ